MTRYLLWGLVPVFAVALAASRPTARAEAPYAERHQALWLAGMDSLTAAVTALGKTPPTDVAAAQAAFRRARREYKQVEYWLTAVLPEAELTLNGPPMPRPSELVVEAVLPPTGLQVIEGALYPAPVAGADTVVSRQVRLMLPTLVALRQAMVSPAALDARVFDACRQELARVTSLGLAGFDASVTDDGIVESADALTGMRRGLAVYRPDYPGAARASWEELDRSLGAAIAVLRSDPDFERFDRFAFISAYARPIAGALTRFQARLAIPRFTRPTAWFTGADAIDQLGALDPSDYAPSDAAHGPRVIDLGRRLFVDPRLSGNGRRSCATCHQPERAFTDGRALAQVDHGTGPVRNTPTLLNAALQPFQFADQRARTLEDQSAVVLANPREMNLPLDSAVARLRADTALSSAFASAYDVPRDEAVTARRLQTTLAAFVRSLVAVRSPFDLALAGEAVLTGEAQTGFNLFMGKAGCGTCHFAPTFGGSLPPALLESEPEVIGVPAIAIGNPARLDPDLGVAGFDRAPIHRHAFRTPSLRNVALTAPYMHNGVFRNLGQVVEFYDRGGGGGLGLSVPNQTLSPEPLHLNRGEKRALVAFLRSLTDTVVRERR